MASKSLEPSLMPRSAVDQGLIMAGSFATGYAAGAAAGRVLGALPVIGATAVLRLAGVTATDARSNRLLRGASTIRPSGATMTSQLGQRQA